MDAAKRQTSGAPAPGRRAGFFEAIVGSSTDLLAVIDAEGLLTYVGPSTAPATADWLHRSVFDLVHPDDVERAREHLRDVVGGPGRVTSWLGRLKPGEGHDWRQVEVVAVNRLDSPEVRGVILTIRDVSEKAHVLRALRTLGEGNRALLHSADEPTLVRRICRAIVESGGYALAWVGYCEDDPGQTVRPVACAGIAGYLDGLDVSWGDNERGRGPTGRAIRTGKVVVTPDLQKAAAFSPWRRRAVEHGLRTSLALPISKQGSVIGALNIYSDELGTFDAPSVALLQELADDLAYGIGRLRDAERLGRSLEATIDALAAMSELRDPYTAGHQCRVGSLASEIAVTLGLPDDLVTGIRVAGELHDVGKIAVPTEILTRPALLTAAEMELVKCHPRAGYDIVKGIDFPWPVGEMVLQHHERLDGSGYPLGLHGDQIVLGSRVLAVADTVEAMSNHRPYRPAVGRDYALEEITAGAGRLYDREVVECCVGICLRDGFSFDTVGSRISPDRWVTPPS